MKNNKLDNHDLHVASMYIPANTSITEVSVAGGVRRASSARLTIDVPLNPKEFKIIEPNSSDQIPDHTCFEFKSPHTGNITYVYVLTTAIKTKNRTWVDDHKQDFI